MKRSIFLFFLCLNSLAFGQTDSTSLAPTDSLLPAGRPAWFVEPADTVKPTILQEVRTYLKAEVLPELIETEERTQLKIRIPWREDVIIPYVPPGLLPAESPPPYNPTVAWQRSALFPGLGQVYNGSSWKVPIFWAGYGAAAWWISYNHSQYRRFGLAYSWAVDNNPATVDEELAQRYDAQGLRSARNEFRQNRDNGVLILLGWHGLQMIEAYVDAHLNDFDVTDDLGLRWRPVLSGNGAGFAVNF